MKRYRYDRAINSAKATQFREHLFEMGGVAAFLQNDAITDLSRALFEALEELRQYRTFYQRHAMDFPTDIEIRDASEVVAAYPLAVFAMQAVLDYCDTCATDPLSARNPMGKRNGTGIIYVNLRGE